MQRHHIEYVVRKLHYFKSGRQTDKADFNPTGGWFMTNCLLSRWTHEKKYGGHIPMDDHPSMGVKEQEGVSTVNCFSCKFKSGLMGLVKEFGHYAMPEGLMTQDEYSDLMSYVILAEEDDYVEINGEMKKKAEPVPEDILECLGEVYDEGADYAEKRGLSPEDIELFQIGWAEKYERLMFPIITRAGFIPMVQGRVIGEPDVDTPKYKNFPRNFEKQQLLYGEHLVKDETEILVIVEGMADVVTANRHLREAGMYPTYVALGLMGSEPHEFQLAKIVAWGREVIPFGDNDSPGKLLNKKLADKLKHLVEISLVTYPEGINDPDELGEGILQVLDERRNYLQNRLEMLFRQGERK